MLRRFPSLLLSFALAVAACAPAHVEAPAPKPASAPAPAPPSAGGVVAPPPAAPSAAERLDAVARRLSVLGRELFDFWSAHGPDEEHGGFHGFLDRRGEPREPSDKGIIQQARHLWTFSMWHARREPKPEVKAVADRSYRFLLDHFRDKDGEFFFKVSRAGKPLEKKKVLYGQAFAIYALAEYARAFGVKEASDLALQCFRSIDRRAHDAVNGGYDQRRDPAWLPPGSEKETNTHLHLMEAFALLYEVTRDETVRARTEELVRVFTDRIVQKGDYAHKDFLLDWRPFGPEVVSYGHDLETAWLLRETARSLGRPDDERVRSSAERIGLFSAERGFDAAAGGYFEEGPLAGAPVKLEKIWWIQAEAIPALVELHRLTGERALLDRLERTLDFIERAQRDREYGEWYWGVLPNGAVGPHGDHKGEEWKASYHALRAVVYAEDWIRGRATAGR